MSKRTGKHPAKPTQKVVSVTTQPISPREQLRVALDELRVSTTYLLSTALTEVQNGAAVLLQELKVRANTWLGSIKQPQRMGQRSNHAPTDHLGNPALS
ncbi:MAG: hypothetical protein RL701_505 [Pseudomonadota bacterium]